MSVVSTISVISTLIGFLFTLSIFCTTWRHRGDRTARYFILALLCVLIWSLGYVFEMVLNNHSLKLLAAKLEYVGISLLPVSWFIFSSLYTRRFKKLLDSRYIYLLFLIPGLTLFFVFTNEFHNFVWQTIRFSRLGNLEILIPDYGWWFWVHAVYSYAVFVGGSLVLIYESFLYSEVHRKRATLLVSAAIIPIVSNVIYLSRSFLFDPTPISFSLSMFLLFVGMYRMKLLHIVPIARNEVVEGMRDAVIVIDRDNVIIDMNRSAEQFLSTERKRVIGKKIFEVFIDFKEILDLLRTRDGKRTWRKSNRFYETSVTTLRDRRGEMIGKLMIIRDITDIKTYEAELKRLNKNLEREVKRRTEEIEKLLRQKDEFISQLGHDLKTPLTPILSLLPIVREKVEDRDIRRLIDISLRNARYMKNLVVDTLNLAKLNLPNVQFNIKDVRLRGVIEESIRDNEHLMRKKNIKPINRVREDIIVKADKLRLKEVFSNLISNSTKYTPEGGRIEFSADSNGKEVIVEVRDNGIGLEGNQKHRIFDEFYKADESRHSLESSGLGLTICKRIIEKHGGKIWAESEGLGKGTSIYFTLPIGGKDGEKESSSG